MTRRQSKPIRIFYSTLSQRFYASRAYRISNAADKGNLIITGEKFDVTDEIAGLIKQYNIIFLENPP
jgi:hypothetical protein